MTTIKLCEEGGYLWAVALPEGVEECENGPVLGPPEGLYKNVHNAFAKAGIYNAFDLLGTPRRTWLRLLDEVGVPRSYAHQVVHVYQRGYFEEKEDDE
ncbi:MAG: hypothetical protein WC196_05225 [Bacilli bacterium]|jgi:hypothetical protein